MKTINAQEVIRIIPDELLDQLSVKHKVDYSVKKLQGKTVFQLFLYGVISCKRVSLRILEAIFQSEKFQTLFSPDSKKVKHSGIGMRLTKINPNYFQDIFDHLIRSNQVDAIFFNEKKINVRKIDSTIVTLSGKLLKMGMDDHEGTRLLKYTTEINQGIPVNILLFKDQKYYSEENALPEIVKTKTLKKSLNIAIFDRGIQKKKTYREFSKEKISFISRLTLHKYVVLKSKEIANKNTKTLTLLSDERVQFLTVNEKEKPSKEEKEISFRVITGRSKETKSIIKFITNIEFLQADEITDLYKSRWEIETFFRFIKQELNFSKLLSRSENGILAVLFLTMISAILLTIYKKVNKIIGWMVVKIRFIDELESSLMRNWNREMIPAFYEKKNRLLALRGSG